MTSSSTKTTTASSTSMGSSSRLLPSSRYKQVLNPAWTDFTEGILHSSIRSFVVTLGTRAARYPFTTVGATCFISLVLLATGFFTNFYLELNQLDFLTPTGSLPDVHSDWIRSQESGFPLVRPFYMIYHLHGTNILHAEAIRAALKGIEVVHQTQDFHEVCSQSTFIGTDREPTCWTSSITAFWDHQLDIFEQELQEDLLTNDEGGMTQDEWVRTKVSGSAYPDHSPVFHEAIMGYYQGYNTTTKQPVDYTDAPPVSLNSVALALSTDNQLYIESAQSLVVRIDVPDIGSKTDDLETRLLNRLADFQDQNNHPPNGNPPVLFEYFTMNGYQTEMMRALYIDLPLVGVLVVVMVAFTVFVFYNRHEPVHSRGLVGLFSMSTIGLSLWAGYGIMWCIGVPLTTIAIMIPFVVVGVGLDDTFIITGTYFRLMRDHPLPTNNLSYQQKIQHTIYIIEQTLHEVGVSITMTTTTTLIAFMLGSASTIPAVRWLCWYAAVCLFVVYIYQVTCFVALLALDERRVQAGRKDLCFWIVVDGQDDDVHEDSDDDTDQDKLTKDGSQNSKVDNTSDTVEARDSLEGRFSTDDDDDDDDENDHYDEIDVDDYIGTTPDAAAGKNKQQVLQSSLSVDTEETQDTEETPSDKSGANQILQQQNNNNNNDAKIVVETLPSADQHQHQRQRERQHQRNTAAQDNALQQKTLTERFMGWYADQLLKPVSKLIVLLLFVAYFAGTVYSTTLLHQEFNIKDYIPKDSFMTSFMLAYEDYSTVFRYIGVYFRNVDQADPEIQQQMMDYVQELSELEQIGEEPAFFWLRDFQELINSDRADELPFDIAGLPLNQQVDFALSVPQLNQIYGQDIVRDPHTGNITASRTYLYLRNIDMYNIQDQLDMLHDQRSVTLQQDVNQADKRVNNEMSFFTFDDLYFYWELYATVVDELIFTTISCVIVVSVIAFVFIPHWTSLVFVCPLLIMLYFNLLGTMQLCGIKVNAITYFIIVMAIGLLVDFLMHVLLRYYETTGKTRHEKVKQTLETMGASIMLGGFTTWLGVIPLAFSTTKIFMTVFICFLAMVTLGCAAGLVFLPVLLSMVGPVISIHSDDEDGHEEPSNNNKLESCKGGKRTDYTRRPGSFEDYPTQELTQELQLQPTSSTLWLGEFEDITDEVEV